MLRRSASLIRVADGAGQPTGITLFGCWRRRYIGISISLSSACLSDPVRKSDLGPVHVLLII
jgi:hypothetical protein